jgi:hypothetical protein
MTHDYPPISFFTADSATFKWDLLLFYEQGVLGNFRQLVTEQLEYSADRYLFQRRAVEREQQRREADRERGRDDELEQGSRRGAWTCEGRPGRL